MKFTKYSIISTLFVAICSFANAQGSNFVLLGGGGEEIAAEKKTVRPLTAPFLNEDAFITTDVRAWFVHHQLGELDGDLEVTALQLRVALTETLQAVVYKDGYSNFSENLGGGDEGWNDLGLGLKWALFQDVGSQLFIAVGAGYEFGVGDDQVLQDTDEYRLWVSANKGFDKLHFGATANYVVADGKYDGNLGNSDMLTLHLHADYYVNKWFSPVVEVNGYFVQEANSNNGGSTFSGVDVASINGGEDNDTITYALGFELRPLGESLGLRTAYETQLNNSEDSLFGYRWTFSAVYEF
ncbi:MAG: hypothetical protein ACJAUA_001018 [Zhongshania aliphaticivorans]|jgi:hypothetical protein